MEVLVQLEAKILQLVSLVKTLKDENNTLKEEILHLTSQVQAMENSLMAGRENATELAHERELATMIVGDLIKSIDMLDLSDHKNSVSVETASECER
jgi:hypothetical protein